MSAPKNASSRLRHRVILQQEIQTADDGGGYARSWEDIATLWAEILPITSTGSSHEILFAGQLMSDVSHHVFLRYRVGVTTAMRLAYGERIFNIRSVIDVEERREILALLVSEGSAG